MSTHHQEQYKRLLQLIHDTIQQDEKLREKYQVGDKFRFIHDRLQGLRQEIEDILTTTQSINPVRVIEVKPDEMVVYVYLYNAQGSVMRSWQSLLAPKLFYEYSVNRPIYTEKRDIDAFLRSRSNPMQHGYLSIIVKRDAVKDASVKDALGNVLVKVREGSLDVNRFIAFHHNGLDYTLTGEGELVRDER